LASGAGLRNEAEIPAFAFPGRVFFERFVFKAEGITTSTGLLSLDPNLPGHRPKCMNGAARGWILGQVEKKTLRVCDVLAFLKI
jgi:hypothetical protein